MEGSSASVGSAVSAEEARRAPTEPRQRWRLTFRRRPDAPPLAQRDQTAAWEAALLGSGLPLVGTELPAPRPRLAFAAPLSLGMPAEAELVELLLYERLPVAEVRARLARSLPAGHDLVDIVDVWLGEPAVAGQLAAADYLVQLRRTDRAPDPGRLDSAIAQVLAASSLRRTREKGDRTVEYDLRPLLVGIDRDPVVDGRPLALRIRTRFDPERGVGRPEEVLGALADHLGAPLEASTIIRERLLLADEL